MQKQKVLLRHLIYPHNRMLIIVSAATSLLLPLIVAYFRWFPTIINAQITNLFIVSLIIALASLLAYGSLLMKNSRDVYYLLPQALIFTFIARAVPHLRLSYPPLHDPYYYFASTLNIIEGGTLEPILSSWYGAIETHLHWPVLQTNTAALTIVTGIEPTQFMKFLPPLLGTIFFLAVYILAKAVTKKDGISFLSALIASLSDVNIFYQSEYHPQGIEFLFFVLFIYCSARSRALRFSVLAMIFIFAFLSSHHFSSIFIGIIGIAYLFAIRTLSSFPALPNKFRKIFEDVKYDYGIWILLIVLSLFYHFQVYPYAVTGWIREAMEAPALFPLLATGPEVPLIDTFLNSTRWVTFLLATISILWIIRSKKSNELRLAILFGCLLFSGVIGNYLFFLPVDRIEAFYIPFAAIFASLTLYRVSARARFSNAQNNKKALLITLIASLVIVAGFFNSQTPAYFFKNSDVNTYYWYSNDLSSIDKYEVTGKWLEEFTSKNSEYITEFDTRVVPFFYGKRPFENITYPLYPEYAKGRISTEYIILNPSIPYCFEGEYLDKKTYIASTNVLYTNEILIIIHQRGE